MEIALGEALLVIKNIIAVSPVVHHGWPHHVVKHFGVHRASCTCLWCPGTYETYGQGSIECTG